MWWFSRPAGPQRCDVYFRKEGVYVLTRVCAAEALWLPSDPWQELPGSPDPKPLGQAVLACLRASRALTSNSMVTSTISRRFPDWKAFAREAACLQVERRDGVIQVTPLSGGESLLSERQSAPAKAGPLGSLLLKLQELASPSLEPDEPPAEPDLPRAFGFKACWMAAPADRPEQLAQALGLRDLRPSGWAHGVERALEGEGVFVTPAVNGWCMAVGELPAPEDDPISDPCLLLLSEVSQKLGEAQFFCSNRTVDLFAWARAREGTVERAFAAGEVDWSVGRSTPQEADFHFFDPAGPEAASDAYWARSDLRHPGEDCVLQVAAGWSLDPSRLEDQVLGRSLGLLGRLAL